MVPTIRSYVGWKSAENWQEFAGQKASIATNGHLSLPWSVFLEDGRKLCDCGSYATAERAFRRMGLEAI